MITISIPTARDFWKAVCLFAYRRWAIPGEKKPVGIPGNRDPDIPCGSYEPIEWKTPAWNDCQTDGHYLCDECCHRAPHANNEPDEFPEAR
jgi:hypothetical protein